MVRVCSGCVKFYNEHPSFKYQKGSYARRVAELALKIICSFWRSVGSYFQDIKLNEATQKKFDVLTDDNKIELGNALQAISKLKHKRGIGNDPVAEVCHRLIAKYGKNNPESPSVELVIEFAYNKEFQTLATNDEAPFVLVPVVLQDPHRLGDHIVAVLYDRENNRVELYDPKGLTSLDRVDFVKYRPFKLTDVVTMVAKAYGNQDTTLWENTTKHQYDSHNCGIYVLDYFERRLAGKTPHRIAATGLSFDSVNNSKRDYYINMLIS